MAVFRSPATYDLATRPELNPGASYWRRQLGSVFDPPFCGKPAFGSTGACRLHRLRSRLFANNRYPCFARASGQYGSLPCADFVRGRRCIRQPSTSGNLGTRLSRFPFLPASLTQRDRPVFPVGYGLQRSNRHAFHLPAHVAAFSRTAERVQGRRLLRGLLLVQPRNPYTMHPASIIPNR